MSQHYERCQTTQAITSQQIRTFQQTSVQREIGERHIIAGDLKYTCRTLRTKLNPRLIHPTPYESKVIVLIIKVYFDIKSTGLRTSG